MKDKILLALSKLDKADDSHWTADGAPRVDVVAHLAGIAELKRSDITDAAPQFNRDTVLPAVEIFQDGVVPAAPIVTQEALDMDAQIADLEKQIFDTHASEAKAKDDRAKLEKQLDKARLARDAAFPPLSPAAAFQRYVENEQKKRMDRAGMIANLEDTVGKKLPFTVKAPIDAAMARRKGFGLRRPERAVNAG